MYLPEADIERILPAEAVCGHWHQLMANYEPRVWAVRLLAFKFGVQEIVAEARLKELGLLPEEKQGVDDML